MGLLAAYAVPHPPLIVPAVGQGRERAIQQTIDAYEFVAREIVLARPEILIVVSPHAPLLRDAFHLDACGILAGSMHSFGADDEPLEAVVDASFRAALVEEAARAGIPLSVADGDLHSMDHASYVPLHFIREAFRLTVGDERVSLPCPVARIGLSGLPFAAHRELGRCIATAASRLDRRTVLVASGDLSHKLREDGPYGFAPEGPVFDRLVGEAFSTGELERLFEFDEDFCAAAAECGLRSFQIMAGALDRKCFRARLHALEGPFGVGYAVASFRVFGVLDGPEADACVALARACVEAAASGGRAHLDPSCIPGDCTDRRAGAFVSIHKDGELRGCMGTVAPLRESLAQEIASNAVAASSRDPRFPPVSVDELERLEYSVDVLEAPEPIGSSDELDPARYGVVVSKGTRRGVLLPALPGVDDAASQVAIACAKAGIAPNEEGIVLERFEVVRHGGERPACSGKGAAS